MKPKTARIELRVSQRTLKQWRADAKRADMTLSEWISKRCSNGLVYREKAGWYVLHGVNWSAK